MVTGAALATINRLPVLLLPGDVFASRRVNPALQQLELPGAPDVSVNDALRPVSRFFDRVNRPDQLPASLLEATRVLTDQAETGAVTIALPQDVQAEAFDFPDELFAERVWYIPRPAPDPEAMNRALELLRGAARPLIIAGGGVVYSEATGALRALCEQTGIPVAETQAGKGSLPYDHPSALGAIGATGTLAANELARDADLVLAVGTPALRLHDGVVDRVPGSRAAPDRPQRGAVRRRTSWARSRWSATPAAGSRSWRPAWHRIASTRRMPTAPPPPTAPGMTRWRGSWPRTTGR